MFGIEKSTCGLCLYDFSVQDFYKKHNLTGLNSKYASALADYLNLTKDERKNILSKFPDSYITVVVVWEISDSELLLRGCDLTEIEEKGKLYERPDTDENFDEVICILT